MNCSTSTNTTLKSTFDFKVLVNDKTLIFFYFNSILHRRPMIKKIKLFFFKTILKLYFIYLTIFFLKHNRINIFLISKNIFKEGFLKLTKQNVWNVLKSPNRHKKARNQLKMEYYSYIFYFVLNFNKLLNFRYLFKQENYLILSFLIKNFFFINLKLLDNNFFKLKKITIFI